MIKITVNIEDVAGSPWRISQLDENSFVPLLPIGSHKLIPLSAGSNLDYVTKKPSRLNQFCSQQGPYRGFYTDLLFQAPRPPQFGKKAGAREPSLMALNAGCNRYRYWKSIYWDLNLQVRSFGEKKIFQLGEQHYKQIDSCSLSRPGDGRPPSGAGCRKG